jgi:hypothetical protein
MPDVRLIDANALEKFLNEKVKTLADENGWHDHYVSGFDDAITYVENAPSEDAVPVVRCRECVHNEDEDVCPFVRVNRGENWFEIIKPHPDGFCHNGAKMDGGAE